MLKKKEVVIMHCGWAHLTTTRVIKQKCENSDLFLLQSALFSLHFQVHGFFVISVVSISCFKKIIENSKSLKL